jgi:hypothetical protein
MGGGGKAESTPWRGPAGAQRPPHGGGYSALGTRGQSPWRSQAIGNGGDSLSQPCKRHKDGALATARRGRRRGGEPSARQGCCAQRSAAARSERETVARPARREARAPAGQHENTAPSGARSAGQSASFRFPAQLPAPDCDPDGPRRPARSAEPIKRVARQGSAGHQSSLMFRFKQGDHSK